jgi:hypothetical protein
MKETRNEAQMVAFLGSILVKGSRTAFDAQPGLFTQRILPSYIDQTGNSEHQLYFCS